ncbi:hypothetical protein EHS25_001013 [Saitozyma podzolica]|uniref:D-isomer specific 2-hydroxyacid dehydrogenase NAD-binding domain-containing protein n=1 Tax=Saitozyma podzolica TaxID=1890683 RepID=A0A427YH45_9TREE|nr:hypothetical protein EHS25_001013 [Saitozyma podzolica]
MVTPSYSTIAVTLVLRPDLLDRLHKQFQTVHYYPKGDIPAEYLKDVDVWYTFWRGIPEWITFDQIPRSRLVLVPGAGVEPALNAPAMRSPEAKKQIPVCNVSGIHAISIPQYVIGQIINVYSKLHSHNNSSRSAEYPDGFVLSVNPGFQSIRGKTAGFLGYGNIARETARLLQAFGANIIAANSDVKKRGSSGYIIEGTGDPEGVIPSEYFSSNDPSSLQEFLSRTDILIACLPSTPKTTWMLEAKHFEQLRDGALFVNVGRGTLVRSGDPGRARSSDRPLERRAGRDQPGTFAGRTSAPEPPRVLITPHMSGHFGEYYDLCTDVLLENVKRLREGRELLNVVDPAKGY